MIANGRVVTQSIIVGNLGVLKTIRIHVTSSMSPQARFVAFYRVNNELVVDSAIMEVEEELPNKVCCILSLVFNSFGMVAALKVIRYTVKFT